MKKILILTIVVIMLSIMVVPSFATTDDKSSNARAIGDEVVQSRIFFRFIIYDNDYTHTIYSLNVYDGGGYYYCNSDLLGFSTYGDLVTYADSRYIMGSYSGYVFNAIAINNSIVPLDAVIIDSVNSSGDPFAPDTQLLINADTYYDADDTVYTSLLDIRLVNDTTITSTKTITLSANHIIGIRVVGRNDSAFWDASGLPLVPIGVGTTSTLPELLANYEGTFDSIVDMLNTRNYDEYEEIIQDAVDRTASKEYGKNVLGDVLSAPFNAMQELTIVTTPLGTITLADIVSTVMVIMLVIAFLKLFAGG